MSKPGKKHKGFSFGNQVKEKLIVLCRYKVAPGHFKLNFDFVIQVGNLLTNF